MRRRNIEEIKTHLQHYSFGYGDTTGVPKMMFWNKKEKCHYTVLFNDYRKEVDIHKTSDVNKEDPYEEIIKVKYYSCLKLMLCFSSIQSLLLKKYWFSRVINLDELIDLDASLLPADNREMTDVLFEQRGKKFDVKSRIKVRDLERMYIAPDELNTVDNEIFQVYCNTGKRLIFKGILLKDLHNRVSYFISKKKMNEFSAEMSTAFVHLVSRSSFASKQKLLSLLKD